MSLKVMHIVLVAILTAGACVAGALWAAAFFQGGGWRMLGASVAGLAFGVGLIFHGLDFWARTRELPWL